MRKPVCSVCCFIHDKDQPHNQTSNYYRRDFKALYGREPTWLDAFAHCSEATKSYWIKHLTDVGLLPKLSKS